LTHTTSKFTVPPSARSVPFSALLKRKQWQCSFAITNSALLIRSKKKEDKVALSCCFSHYFAHPTFYLNYATLLSLAATTFEPGQQDFYIEVNLGDGPLCNVPR
jgi:hypothetical protein